MSPDKASEIAALIETLRKTDLRLDGLTSGEVDTVADRDGQTFLLQRTQDRLRFKEAEKQGAILNAMPAHVALLGVEGVIVSVNDAWRRFADTSALLIADHGVGTNYLDVCDRANGKASFEAAHVAAGIRSVLFDGVKRYSIEYPCHSPTEQRWFLMTATPLADDPPSGAIVMHLEVTKEWNSIESLRVSESRFRSLVDLSSDWYWEQDDEYRFTALGGRVGDEPGLAKDQISLIGRHRWDLSGITPIGECWEQHKALLEAHKPFRNFEYQRALENGVLRYVSTSGEPVFDADGNFTGYRGVSSDITERTAAAHNLRESEHRFSNLLGSVQLVSLMADHEARITYCNDYLLNLTGWRREEIIGRNMFDVFIPPDVGDITGLYASLLADLPETRHRENEIMTRTGERRLIRWNNSVLRSGSGEVIGTASIGEDITESQRAKEEILRLNADLEHRVAERTAELEAANRELEAFDYSVAHDLRAPIRHIEGFSSILLEDYAEKLDERGREYLTKVQGAGKKMDTLVADLLALSLVSRCQLNRSDVDVSAQVRLVFATLQEAEPERDIEYVIGPGINVNADIGLLRIVLENLIGNAWKFTAKQPGAKIEFGCARPENVPTFFVRDNGAGFDAGYADRLFAPFQRLHAQSDFKGTGIGLATVSRIITRHGGKVWAEGIVNHGATFHFTLPL